MISVKKLNRINNNSVGRAIFPPRPVTIGMKSKNRIVHFIGIGGIGVSALARWYLRNGWRVHGSDIEDSEITQALVKEGASVIIGPHSKKNIPDNAALIIYTAAAPSNPEIAEGRRRKIPAKSYAEALGGLTAKYLTIAVSGSHGKSTTTSVIALVLAKAGFDPTVFVGTKLREFAGPEQWMEAWLSDKRSIGSNFRHGASPVLVIEADEWNGSFWNYTPAIAVVTNIDKEHLDFYKTEKGVEAGFRKFILRTRLGGHVVINADDKIALHLGNKLCSDNPGRFLKRMHYYSISSPAAARIRTLLRLPGRHNASNAMAAYEVAKILDIPDEIFEEVISGFEGAWRRFEKIGEINGAPVIADYAHHPTEIRSTIDACLHRFGPKKVIAVFQPHHYERTRDLFKEFSGAFNKASAVCLLDIYEVAGREKKHRSSKISAFSLASSLSKSGVNAHYIPYLSHLSEFLHKEANDRTVILMMGAGSIWKLSQELVM